MIQINGQEVTPLRLVSAIRQKFPHPSSVFHAKDKGTYCVGGAFCSMMAPDSPRDFPNVWMLATSLRVANPALSGRRQRNIQRGVAIYHASRIIRANDSGKFDAAWGELRSALTYRRNT
jgi:hypothetical protein